MVAQTEVKTGTMCGEKKTELQIHPKTITTFLKCRLTLCGLKIRLECS